MGDLGESVEFLFADRVIWNARICDPSHRSDGENRKKLADGRNVRRSLWPLFTAAFGVLLVGLWIAAVVILPISSHGPVVDGAEGSLTIVGSTAFTPP